MNYAIHQRQHRLRLAEVQLMLANRETANNIALASAHKIIRSRRTVSIRPWLERRLQYGQYSKLLQELKIEDENSFRNFLRIDPRMFHELHQRLQPRLLRKDTWFRKSLDPWLKLAVTLRYLASGDNYHSLMYAFRVAHNSISLFIPEVS